MSTLYWQCDRYLDINSSKAWIHNNIILLILLNSWDRVLLILLAVISENLIKSIKIGLINPILSIFKEHFFKHASAWCFLSTSFPVQKDWETNNFSANDKASSKKILQKILETLSKHCWFLIFQQDAVFF